MTVQDAYEIALSLDFSTPQQDDSMYDHAIAITNLFLSETLANENAIRHEAHMAELAAPPTMTAFDETIPYSDKIVNGGLPLFMAHILMKDDGDNVWSSRYYNMYINTVQANTPLTHDHTIDVWRW